MFSPTTVLVSGTMHWHPALVPNIAELFHLELLKPGVTNEGMAPDFHVDAFSLTRKQAAPSSWRHSYNTSERGDYRTFYYIHLARSTDRRCGHRLLSQRQP